MSDIIWQLRVDEVLFGCRERIFKVSQMAQSSQTTGRHATSICVSEGLKKSGSPEDRQACYCGACTHVDALQFGTRACCVPHFVSRHSLCL